MKAYERLLEYVEINTTSDENNYEETPSTARQRELARFLETELKRVGFRKIFLDEEHAYVYGKLDATEGMKDRPKIGFIAHLDTVADVGGGDTHPQIIRNYQGEDIRLGESGLILRPADYCTHDLCGKTLITTDGTSVLGADDKAGIACIMTMCEELILNELPHGQITVCFTPDEEIGHGAALLDMDLFDASFAYTVDGSAPEELEYETFNAAKAVWEITGRSVHPGTAKGLMVNAIRVAMQINSMLPQDEVPSMTEGREGFFHMTNIGGDVSKTRLSYIIRDHDEVLFEMRKEKMRKIEKEINALYGYPAVKVTITDQYRNMLEVIRSHPEAVEAARKAFAMAGIEPVSNPVRGGTDGAQLSFRGLPCPNIGNGSYAFHGPYEFAVPEEMDQTVEVLHNIVKVVCEM